MKIALFPGSFKPPHSGHLKVVESIMKKYKPDKLYLIISNKPRLLEPPFSRKLSAFTKGEMEEIAKKYGLHLPDSRLKSGIEQAAEKGRIPAVNAETTYKFWQVYLQLLPDAIREKIKVSIANQPSPVLYSFVIVKNIVKPQDELLLIKAKKDEANSRFSMFDNLDCKKEEILIPTFKDFNSWQMREAMAEGKWKIVEDFFPKKLDTKQKKYLLGLLKK